MSDKPLNSLDGGDESLLDRWSRRKREVAMEASDVGERAAVPAAEVPTQAQAELTDADMPPLESLDEHADYSGFFSPKVSEALRQQALQKLFRSAVFNVCDGLDDYAEDFTNFEKLGDVMTAELRHRLRQEAKRAAERAEAETESQEPEALAQEDQRTAELSKQDQNSSDANPSLQGDHPTEKIDNDEDETQS